MNIKLWHNIQRYIAIFLVYLLIILPVNAFIIGETILNAAVYKSTDIISSPNPVGSGARAIGMGGAFIAVADDATAASWNPAGLIQLEEPEISIVGAYTNTRICYNVAEHAESNNTNNFKDSNLNYFSVAHPFHFYRNFVISLNYQRLFEFKNNHSYWKKTDSASLSDTYYRQNGYLGALGFAAAVEITPYLSFGGTLNIWTDELFWKNKWYNSSSSYDKITHGNMLIESYSHIKKQHSSFKGVNLNLGLMWNISSHLTMGAVLKTPFTASAHGEYSFTSQTVITFLGNHANTDTYESMAQNSIKIRMPLSYGIGLAWRFSDIFTIGMDIYRTEWSQFMLRDEDGIEYFIDGSDKSRSDVKNTIQVHLGSEYLFISKKSSIVIPVRAGLFYDQAPAHRHVTDFFGIATGAGITYKEFVFDVAYQIRWSNNIDTGSLIGGSRADKQSHTLLTSIIIHF